MERGVFTYKKIYIISTLYINLCTGSICLLAVNHCEFDHQSVTISSQRFCEGLWHSQTTHTMLLVWTQSTN